MEIHLLEYTEQHKMLSLGMLQNGVKNLEEIRKEPATMALILIGKIRFLLIYLLGGIAGNVVSLLLELKTQEFSVSAGASGAVFAVMGAMIYIVIRNKGWLGDLSMRQILVMAAFSLYFGFTSSGVDNAAHIGGLLAGFVLAVLFWHPSGSRGIYT